ncbi:hypothetical protein BDDG_12023 [Blastomyces dermatitidis ATCC 18188]|uniref:Uncharacterized protein n=1 Tax=Ajellomyces dermatitidis (strain ATCC 18188 / CBS 674.68) TaxID=653446 RepID=A0A0J9EMH1_AJEDA|nr:hypothetical protein BDDG_12023 [Blastomyces dermatitidis ATCC 18188]
MACKAAAVISSATSGLLTVTCQETANTLNSSEPTVELDDSSTSTRNITTVREASVRDSLEDLLTDLKITALSILKNLTRAKASMEWKYYYKACVKEVNRLKYTRWKEIMKMKG